MKRLFALSVVIMMFLSCNDEKTNGILVFSKTEGFRHESIGAGIQLLKKIGQEQGYTVDATESAKAFRAQNLKDYKVVVFLNTTGDVLDESQQLEFKRFIQAGGSYLGIHAAADTEFDWPWYGGLVGGYFNGHPSNPNVRDASIDKTEHRHISTDHLDQRWDRTDEWYNYKTLNADITPVLNLDESSYEGGTNGDYHPIAWYHEYDGGRAYYTGGGHTDESYEEEDFVKHIEGALAWLIGDGAAVDYTLPTVMPEENRFTKNELDNYFNEPMELDLLPDGRIIFIERKGAIKLYDPDLKATTTLTTIDVYSGEEDGLIGLAVDPDFGDNNHIFLCYSHPEKVHQSISRFSFDPDAGDEAGVLSEEVVILTVPTQRDECCHSGGSLEFDHNGFLWASFGDNTNPHQSQGHSPSDERPGRAPFDAQKSSSNTNDLRGKIIRISVNDDGTYDIPDGNLFAKDGSEGRPEIYVMGCRNPFRFSIDAETNHVYWGEIGPDARDDVGDRGPRGYDELNQAKGPGFFGWPYFIGDNKSYHDYDFASSTSGPLYDPLNPINDSPNNTGMRELPPAQAAMIWYPYATSEEFPLVGSGSRNAMAGPVYHADRYKDHPNRFPDYYDDKLLIYDWMRGWILAVTFDENDDMVSMERFLPSLKWNNLMDVAMGPEGDLYTLEYGTGWFTANENAILSHITYNPGNRKPEARMQADKSAGGLPLTVHFDASESKDSDEEELEYSWDFGDGNTGSGPILDHTYTTAGSYTARVTVKDKAGEETTSQYKVLAGNTPPEVEIKLAGNQHFYFPGQALTYEVVANDAEDGSIDPKDIALSVDYLEQGYDLTSIAQGHMALSELKSGHPGQLLIGESDCVGCHKVEGTSIGPSYTAVSTKYLSEVSSRSDKISYLTEKIIKGGGGIWGETAMAAHPDIKPLDAKKMADYILSLGEEDEKEEIPATGTYTLEVPKGKKPGGKFVLIASYTDKGADGVEELRTFSNLILTDATVPSINFDVADKASKFKVTDAVVPGLKESFDVVILNDGAQLEYADIDFTDISAVVMAASAPAMFASGGSFEIYLDEVSGDPIYKGEIKTSMQMTGADTYAIPLTGRTGKHKLIAKYKSKNEGAPVGTLMSWTFLPATAL